MSVDLHIHSIASDGLHTPRELLSRAAAIHLTAIAITDHDSVNGVDEALADADEFGVEVIPALELSSHIGDRDVHFLGYWIDHHDAALAGHLEGLRRARVERAKEVLDLLRDYGLEVTFAELDRTSGGGAVGRAHIASLLTQKGHTDSVSDAFERFLRRGACCYVEKEAMSPEGVIDLIRRIGGIPVLAHPGVSRIDEHLPSLIEYGLEGIEAFHADHTLEQIQEYRAIAGRYGLLVTGGSDFHGESVRGLGVGAIDVPDWVLEGLRQRRRA